MDQFKALKKRLGGNKIVTQEIAGSVHLENYALKCFCVQTMKIAPVVFTRSSPSILQILKSCHDKNIQGGVTYIHTFLKHRETPQGRPVRIGKILMLKKIKKVEQPSTHLTHLNQNHLHLQLRTQRALPQAAVLERSPLRAHALADTAAAVPHSTGESGTVLPRPWVLLAIYPQFPRGGGCCSNTRGRGSSADALQACWLAVHCNVNVQPCCAEPSEALKLLSAGRG
eukprot:bmy_12333T0